MGLRFSVAFATFSFLYFNLLASVSVDSLKLLLQQKKGAEQFMILEQLSDYYINNNLDSSFYFTTQLYDAAIQSKNIKYEAVASSSLGLYFFFNGKYFDAEDNVLRAIQLQKQINDTINLAHSYNVLAGIYGESGQYSKSIKTLFEAIRIFEVRGDFEGLTTAYNNMGFLYMKLEKYKKATDYYKKALSIIDDYQINRNKGFLFSNIGICYKEIGDNNNALIYYRLALQQYKTNKTLNAIPILYQSIGNLYAFRLNRTDSAFYYFNSGIKLAKEYDPNSLIELYISLGQLFNNQNEYKKGVDVFNKSLKVAEESEDLSGQMDAFRNLSQSNKKIGNFEQALNYFEKYSVLKDSIDSKEAKTSIASLEEKHENEKNKLLINELNAIHKADRIAKILLIAGVILLIIIMFFVLYGIVQRKKRNQLEKRFLEKEIGFKSKELASHALMMMQKNKMLQGLYNSIESLNGEPLEKINKSLNSIKNQIQHGFKSENEWDLFKLYFEQVNRTFFKRLNSINPNLTQNDLRLAALIKLRLNIKEVASVLNLSPNSVKGARSRLRKKLNLNVSDDLAQFIEEID